MAPPWWPEGEPWPPAGPEWVRLRRRFFVRFAVLAIVVFVAAVVVPIVVVWHLLSAVGVAREPAGLGALLAAAGLVLLIVVSAGRLRGLALPLGDLIEAAGRVEAGDYGARVQERGRGTREMRTLTRAFNQMAERLEMNERQRRTLLADIGHELRTPLAVLQGELEAIVDGVRPADHAHLSATLEETKVLARLVEDLRTLALAEAGGLTLHREPVDFGVLGGDVASAFEPAAEEAGVRIATVGLDGLPLLEVDPVRLHQVLANLVSNAVRHAPAGSEVEIGGRSLDDGGVELWVADEGPGIPPELLPHVFERFAKSPESRGSGLGLSIARQLVEAHGGTIRAESPNPAAPAPAAAGSDRGGPGTRMVVRLPAR